MRLNALFRLAFATAPPHGLTSPHTVTRRLILQKARSHITAHPQRNRPTLPRLAGTRFQVLFHNPSPGHFSPFPHGTRPLSVTRKYSGLPGGPGRFTQDSSSPVLLGIPSSSRQSFTYPAITVYGSPSQNLRLPHRFLTACGLGGNHQRVPQPRTRNTRRLSHAHGLASSAFAHHYSRNHYCFLFLRVLRCFTSPRSLPRPMKSSGDDGPQHPPGSPIRTSPDQRLAGDSPRLIAASHVLHRLLMPRHPPCALHNLTTQRCSHPLCKSQTTTRTTHPATKATSHPSRTTHHQAGNPDQTKPATHTATTSRPGTPHPTPQTPSQPTGKPTSTPASQS